MAVDELDKFFCVITELRYNKLYMVLTLAAHEGHMFPWQPVEAVVIMGCCCEACVLMIPFPSLPCALCLGFLKIFGQTLCQLTAAHSECVFPSGILLLLFVFSSVFECVMDQLAAEQVAKCGDTLF